MNVQKTLRALGIDWEETTGDELQALCPMHKSRTGKEDHNPSWSINAGTGMHMCFSCGYSGGLLRLVADVKGFVKVWGAHEGPDYEEARKWLLIAASMTPEDMEALHQKQMERATYDPPVPMSEARLSVFVPPPAEALRRRGLTADACAEYTVLWDTDKGWWITPLRDAIDGRLIGWQEKGEFERYFKNRPPSMKKSLTLFGVHLLPADMVVVTESPLDAVKVYAKTGVVSVATCGAKVSEAQVQLLRNSKTIVWAMDNPMIDRAGRQACHALLDMTRHYAMNCKYFNYEGLIAKDPGEMTGSEIQDSIDNAISYIHGKAAFIYV